MKKEHWWKFLYAVAALLVVGFGVRLGADWYHYSTSLNSAPFWITVLVRAIEFCVPAAAAVLAGCILKKKGK